MKEKSAKQYMSPTWMAWPRRALPVILFLLVWGGGSASAKPNFVDPENLFETTVISVIDGDTIRIEDGRIVRYLGVDAPELRKKVKGEWVYDPEPFAEEAVALNKKLVEGKKVIIEIDPFVPRDQFGRLLGYVFVDKVMVNEELLKRGLAKADTPSVKMKYRIRFWSIEEGAWTDKRGIWAERDTAK